MEDVVVLDKMLNEFPDNRLKAFNEYSKFRNPDAEAICDLAMYNYIEVRRHFFGLQVFSVIEPEDFL